MCPTKKTNRSSPDGVTIEGKSFCTYNYSKLKPHGFNKFSRITLKQTERFNLHYKAKKLSSFFANKSYCSSKTDKAESSARKAALTFIFATLTTLVLVVVIVSLVFSIKSDVLGVIVI